VHRLVLGFGQQAAKGVSRDALKERMGRAGPVALQSLSPLIDYIYEHRGKQSDQAMAEHHRQACLNAPASKPVTAPRWPANRAGHRLA